MDRFPRLAWLLFWNRLEPSWAPRGRFSSPPGGMRSRLKLRSTAAKVKSGCGKPAIIMQEEQHINGLMIIVLSAALIYIFRLGVLRSKFCPRQIFTLTEIYDINFSASGSSLTLCVA